ncbi:MAG: DUF3562 domain-containing protein [Pseudomonadota bacterium]
MDDRLFESGKEMADHLAAVEHLAEQMHLPADEVNQAYERALRVLLDGARVRIYLSVLAAKHAKAALRRTDKEVVR